MLALSTIEAEHSLSFNDGNNEVSGSISGRSSEPKTTVLLPSLCSNSAHEFGLETLCLVGACLVSRFALSEDGVHVDDLVESLSD